MVNRAGPMVQRLAHWTLNPIIRVQISVGPFFEDAHSFSNKLINLQIFIIFFIFIQPNIPKILNQFTITYLRYYDQNKHNTLILIDLFIQIFILKMSWTRAIIFLVIMSFVERIMANPTKEFKYQIQVIVLDALNVSTALSRYSDIVVMFHAPWCVHCKNMMPTYQQAAKQAFKQQIKIIIAKLDCTQNTQLCKSYEIRGYPSIIYFKDATKVSSYSNFNSLPKLIKFFKSQFGASIQKINQRYYEKLKSFKTVSIVMHSHSLNNPTFESLKSLSEKDEWNNYYFLAIQDKEKIGKIQIIRPFDDQAMNFENGMFLYQEQLRKFIQMYDKPIVTELDQRIVDQTTTKMKNVFIFFNANSIYTLQEIFNETALEFFEQNPGQLLFAIAKNDNKLGKQVSQHIKIDRQKYPFVLIRGSSRTKTQLQFKNIDHISKYALKDLIQKWRDHQLPELSFLEQFTDQKAEDLFLNDQLGEL